jgi:HTH-type transcriptional regulator/antitoxin HigA
MIKNERQYRLTRSQLKAFQESRKQLENAAAPPGVDPRMVEIQRQALKSQEEDFFEELKEYDRLRDGKPKRFVAHSFHQLPSLLIKARIARRLTQKDLGCKLNVSEQQIQRWESNDYSGVSLDTIQNVVEALGIELREEMIIPAG